ncbi:hypothetical protein C4N20_12525 [Fusobacterium ulcerans]|jgi:hypothetical protein|uniref:Secreted protein n=2 Tax=Fusobacterium ulcerans TaxID=861 RepID=A0AAX2JAF5_9FUSO|nr:hypothetical protein [Fusobacterium ulcerans]AVQ28870.1 hypothetical protein C4N20_12525 [Fusobacterium ulcerans]EFS26354.1 hypothetical protein FUAG_01869 [Fusobacterium ulcerans ATCC 49185]EHO84608.1 hypothetical protein HMPREF0402_00168 [Fusobacterium ulcerans 12-1B]SQJ01071.1 Uncharacterised protein [Fusobacterium ulcerans]HJH06310.1 hypothetical protein [Fusobacterium ulcerans]
MKKTTIILSTLMVMVLSNGVIYAEQGDGKPLEMDKIEVSAQEKTEKIGILNDEKTQQTEDKYEYAHSYARERSEER